MKGVIKLKLTPPPPLPLRFEICGCLKSVDSEMAPRPVLILFLHFLLKLIVMFTRRYQFFLLNIFFELIAHMIMLYEMSMILFTYSSQKDHYLIGTQHS